MILETIGIGSLIPLINFFTGENILLPYDINLNQTLLNLGISENHILNFIFIFIILIFLIKNIYIGFYSWLESKSTSEHSQLINNNLLENIKSEENTQDETIIKSLLHTNGKISFSQIKEISSVLGLKVNSFKDINGKVDLKTKINFILDKKFKIKNLSYVVTGDIAHFAIDTEEKKIIKKYLPEYNSKVVLKNTNIKLFNSESDLIMELNGSIKVKDHFDNFKVKKKYNYSKKSFDINGILDLTNSKVEVSKLNYNNILMLHH